MNLPNVWGQGALFAFSGLDGVSTMANSVVGALLGDGLGVMFHTDPRRELRFALRDLANHAPGDPGKVFSLGRSFSAVEYEIVASDIIKCVLVPRGQVDPCPVTLLFYAEDTVIGMTGPAAMPYVCCEGFEALKAGESVWLHEAEGCSSALATVQTDESIRFVLTFGGESASDTVEKSHKALGADIDREVERKLEYYRHLPSAAHLDDNHERTLYKCFSVMKSGVYSPEGRFKTRWTTPDRLPHRQLWLWDSGFHSLGNVYISPDLARETLQAVFAAQHEDGFIPIMASPTDNEALETQPPVLAWGFLHLHQAHPDPEMLADAYDGLTRYLQWNIANRDENQNHLFEWYMRTQPSTCRCGECGMDNSPRFDDSVFMDCIDFSCFMAQEARCMAAICAALGRHHEQNQWQELYEQIKAAVNEELWDEQDEFYYDRRLDTGQLKKVKAVSSFLPLFAGICDESQAAALCRHLTDEKSFATPFPIPSIAVDDPTYGTDMWRGPVWVNYNYMIIRGLYDYGHKTLADDIKRKTMDAIAFWYEHDGVIYEFYQSENRVSPSRLTRKGPNVQPVDLRMRVSCIRDYGWTSALFIALAMEGTNAAR